jgi:drug/metabolite transporter (DMT)-like permease
VPRSPIVIGTLFAVLAAVAFGVTTPFIRRLGTDLGPFATASLLYVGAALGALPVAWVRRRQERVEAPVGRRHLPRLAAVALLGAALAPTLLAWGLQRVSAIGGSLLLNGEAVFTIVLAALVYREHVGRRVALAAGVMLAAGLLTVRSAGGAAAGGTLGALALVGAVLCWALDNVLSRPLAELDPAAVVRSKALLGAGLTALLAVAAGERAPALGPALGLLACGATGYGVSLRLYLLAQRRVGAGRTGSLFALAPFIGAAVAVALGDRSADWTTGVATVLFALGVALHLTERHDHHHAHAALRHEHAHTHDDGHHAHAHAPPAAGPHSHPHDHGAHDHAHPHAPDAHHGHGHGADG